MTSMPTSPVQDQMMSQIRRTAGSHGIMFMVDGNDMAIRTHLKDRRGVRNAVVTYDAGHDLYNVTVHTFRSGRVDNLKTTEYDLLYADQMVAAVLGQAA